MNDRKQWHEWLDEYGPKFKRKASEERTRDARIKELEPSAKEYERLVGEKTAECYGKECLSAYRGLVGRALAELWLLDEVGCAVMAAADQCPVSPEPVTLCSHAERFPGGGCKKCGAL